MRSWQSRMVFLPENDDMAKQMKRAVKKSRTGAEALVESLERARAEGVNLNKKFKI